MENRHFDGKPMTYDAQFNSLRANLARNQEQHDLAARNRASIDNSATLRDLAQSLFMENAALSAITGLLEANNSAWTSALEARKPSLPAPPPLKVIEGGDPEFDATIEEGLQRLRRPEKRRA